MLEKISKDNLYLRKAIFDVYGEKCRYCGRVLIPYELQIDHIVPEKVGKPTNPEMIKYFKELEEKGFDLNAPNHIENYFPSCRNCNRHKTNYLDDAIQLGRYHNEAMANAPKVREKMEQYKDKPPKDIDLFNITIKDDKSGFIKKFTELLFLHTDKEPLCLRDTYIFPRCGDKTAKDVLRNYLSQKAKRGEPLKQLLFIEGLPAVGKSSLVSWLAWNYENKTTEAAEVMGNRRLYVIRLRELESEHVSMDTPLVGLFRYMSKERGFTAKDKRELEAVYKEIGEKLENSVLVLDGFDELCMVDKMQESDSGVYFVKLYNELFRLGKNCKVIVTSRPGYIELTGMNVPSEARENITIEPFSADDRLRWVERYEQKYHINSQLRQTLVTKQNKNIEGLLQIPLAVYMAASRDKPIDSNANIWKLYHNMFHDEAYSRPYSNREAHPMNEVYDSEDLYTLTSEIAWELFQSGRLYMTGEQLMERETLRKLIEKLSDKYSEDQRELLEKCVGISSYFSMRKKYDSYAIEFCHNNVQDFFCCEKLFREINKKYNSFLSREDKINSLIELYISLFKRSELNDTTCFFISERAKCDGVKTMNDFPRKEKGDRLLPTLYQKMLVEGMIYNNLQVNDYMQTIERILYSTAQVYRNCYEPLLGKVIIEWWKDVKAVNKSGVYLFLVRALKRVIGFRSDLHDTDLHGADLRHADLRYADLKKAGLEGSDLYGADLYGADLRDAPLHDANLRKASVVCADLRGANLSSADLSGAKLNCSDLRDAYLNDADLYDASLFGVDLHYAKLYKAKLPDGYSSGNQDDQVAHIKHMRDEVKDPRFNGIII